MELRVLGELLVEVDGATVRLRPAECRLVAGLAVGRASRVRYDALADAVWGERVPASAKHSLQSHVLRIRAATRDELVETVPGGYRLGDGVTVDIDAFESAVERAGDPDVDAAARWAEALTWWRGPPFDDLQDWAPAVAERARLTELWGRAVEEHCAATLATADPATVVAEAERLVQAEPLRERRWALLMTALDAADRRPEAVRTFDRARRTLATELGISPGRELVQLMDDLLRDDREMVVSAPAAPRRHGELPTPLTAIVGRDGEVALATDLVSTSRLVTLTGPGGIGKTRLAIDVAGHVRDQFGAGVWWVELARISQPEAIEPLIASTLTLVPRDGASIRDAVVDAIADRAMLVVFDNAEHLLPGSADVIARLVASCPRLHVLVTSREPLGVAGERSMRVPSLPVEGAAEDLFRARARDADPSFVVDDAAALRVISARLDGIPLAIELAAGRVGTIGLRELGQRLDDRFDLLTATRRGGDERHHTMHATIEWSYDLLDPDERDVFAQLAVFRGRFELEAVEHIVDSVPAHDVARALSSLVDRSMVIAESGRPSRFRVLEPLRHDAAHRLAASGRADAVGARHAAYYATLAVSLDEQRRGPNEIEVSARLDAARDNFRAGFRHAMQARDAATALTIAAPLAGYGGVHVWPEPWTWCAEALELPGATEHPLRADALIGMSEGAWQQGRPTASVELAEAAIALSEPGGDRWRDAHRIIASALIWMGRFDDAEAAAAQSVADQSAAPTYRTLARRCTLALIRNALGRPEPEIVDQLLDDARTIGNSTGRALALHTAGVIVGHTDRALAIEYQRRAADLAAAAGATLVHGFALIVLAAAEGDVDQRRGARAQVEVMKHYLGVGNRAHLRSFARALIRPLVLLSLHEAAAAVEGATSDQPDLGATDDRLRWTQQAEHALGQEFAAAAARGSRMTDDELVAYLESTLDELDRQPPAATR